MALPAFYLLRLLTLYLAQLLKQYANIEHITHEHISPIYKKRARNLADN